MPIRAHHIRRLRREHGQTAVEYALVLLIVALALVTVLTAVSTGVGGLFGKVAAAFAGLVP